MTETIQYPYSKSSASLGVALPLVFFGITFNNFRYAFQGGLTVSWMIIAVADLIFLSFLVFILLKRLIPALSNQIALEFSEAGILDHIRNILIPWRDIKDINIERGRSFSKMVISLKEETDYGQQIAISLRWVKGKDLEICETAQAYYEEMTSLE
ncbi:MAG: hypothetical protein ACXVA2_12090 [Mucilaginibacter sp.]